MNVRQTIAHRFGASGAAAAQFVGGRIWFVFLLLLLLAGTFDGALVLGHNALGSHAHLYALLQSALLTLSPHEHVDFA